jgi:hypothetical protein
VKETISADLKESVSFEIGSSVSEVQAVFVLLKDDRFLHVWAVVPEHDRSVYRKIYAKEKEIIRQFESVEFEVVPSHGRDPRTMITDPDAQLTFIRE